MTKQIEEMANVIFQGHLEDEEGIVFGDVYVFEFAKNIASNLIKKGYRKADEVRKETAGEVLRILHNIGGCDATEPWEKGFDAAIDAAYRQVAKKYGVKLEEDDEQER